MTEPSNGSADKSWTAAGCVEFLDKVAEKGWINPASAKALRITFGKIMSIDEEWEQEDLRALDVEERFGRFRTLRRNDYSDASLRVYEVRFQQAVQMYLARLNNDENWKAYGPSPRGSRGKGKPRTTMSKVNSTAEKDDVSAVDSDPINLDVPDGPIVRPHQPSGTSRIRQIEHVFPLREELDVTVGLPRDLTSDEADALATYIRSLVRRPVTKDT